MIDIVVTPADSPPLEPIGGYWWLPLAAGLLSMVVGVVALVYPGPTVLVIGVLIGIYLVLWGAAATVRGVGAGDAFPTAARIALVLLGLLALIAGLLLIVRPEESVRAIALIIGFWWVLMGVLQAARGLAVPEGRGFNIGLGLLGVAAGTIILAQPEIGLVTLVWISGIGLIVQGALETAAGWKLRKLHKAGLA